MCESCFGPNPHPVCHIIRFVKERRPSISPNFNFLGQLQHFQGALSQKASGGDFFIQHLDNRKPPADDRVNRSQSSSQNNKCQADSVTGDSAHHKDKTQQRHSLSGDSGNLRQKPLTLYLTQHIQAPRESSASSPCEPVKPLSKPTQLQLPSGSASLLEKRKSLTLSLTPLGTCPPSSERSSSSSRQAKGTSTTKTVHSKETGERPEAKTQSNTGSHRQTGDANREQSPSRSKCSRAEVKEQGLLSPFSVTLSKLLDWGERLLLGGVFVHPVRMGQPALPYSC